MGEEFQGGVCGGTWWNPPHNLFSGGLSSPCSVAQLGGGGGSFDMGGFGWPNEPFLKGGKSINNTNNNNQVFDNLVVFPEQMDSSSLDISGFGLSPTSSTTDWNHHNLICNSGSNNNEGNFDSFLQDNMSSSRLFGSYCMGASSPNMMMNSSNFSNNNNNNNSQGASPPMAMTASSNSSGDSSTITCDGGGLATSFPMNSPASYLIQSLFDDCDDQSHHQQFMNNNNPSSNYGSIDSTSDIMSSNSWINTSVDHNPQLQALQSNNKLNGGMTAIMNNGNLGQISSQYSPTTLNSIRVSLLNSLQSRNRGPNSFNQKSHPCANTPSNKVSTEEHRRDSKNNTSNSDQPPSKRPRIETPSPLPTFKVRKEKLGDRITALQQLVSPFGKTDTASVLHEAIEYIKFLHDQVHVLSTPYLKNGNAMQQQGCEKSKDDEEGKQDLRNRGLCLVPISSTYPVAQETPVDFWTPTFGGNAFR